MSIAVQNVALSELMLERVGSTNPSKYLDRDFVLYSIPAYDSGTPETLLGYEIGSAKKNVKTGDVLLSRIVPHIRRSWIVGEHSNDNLIASGEWIVFRDKRFYPAFLRHFLLSDPFHVQFMQTVAGVGGSLLRARPDHVGRIEIPLPPLKEQRRIAAILDKADQLRQKRRQAIALLGSLTQSIFLDMFGDPVTNPKGWPVYDLGKFEQFLTSGSRGWAKYYAAEGRPFIRIQNLKKGKLSLDDIVYVNAPNDAESRRTTVLAGDILISITADLGRIAVVPDEMNGLAHINQHIALFRQNSLNPFYLAAFLAGRGGEVQFASLNRQGVKAGLNFNDIRRLRVSVPPLELQRKFQQNILLLTKLQQEYADQDTLSEALFASLQHRAFSGQL